MIKIYRKVFLRIVLLMVVLECFCFNACSNSKDAFKIIFSSYLSEIPRDPIEGADAYSVIKTSDGNYIVLASNRTHYDLYLIRLDGNGNVLKVRKISDNIDFFEEANGYLNAEPKIFRTEDNKILLIYSKYDSSGYDYGKYGKLEIKKLTNDLEKVWIRENPIKYGGFSAGVRTKECNYIITVNDFILKIDPKGNILWEKLLVIKEKKGLVSTNHYLFTNSIKEDAKGNIILVGKRDDHKPFIAKLSKEGTLIWVKVLRSPQKGCELYSVNSVYVIPNSNKYIVCGYLKCMEDPYWGDFGWVAKINEDGNIEWSINTGKGRNFSVAPYGTGDLIVVGEYTGKYNNHPAILKLDLAGNLKWKKIFQNTVGILKEVKHDIGNSYIAVGCAWNEKNRKHPLIIKFSM